MRHLASGLRRQAPVPVQGASISTRSQRPGEIVEFAADRFRRAHLHVARARALEPVVDRRQPPLVVVGGEDLSLVLHHGGKRQRLAAGAGAEIDHLLAGLGAGKQRGQLRTFVLHFDHALEEGRLGMDRRALGVGRQDVRADPKATRRRLRLQVGQHAGRFVAVGLQRVDAQVERRARGKRRALLRARIAEGAREMRLEPFRIIAGDMRRARPSMSAASSRLRSSSLNASGAYFSPLGEFGDRVAIEPALALEHAEQDRARRCPRP